MQVDLKGRRAIVTGGGRSIGRALAVGLARNGADVAVVYRQDAGAAEEVAEEARRRGGRGLAIQADTGNSGDVRAMVEQVVGEWGGIDILVSNAGVLSR